MSRSTQATLGSCLSAAITVSIWVASVTRTLAAAIAGETSASRMGWRAPIVARRSRIATALLRDAAIERYAVDPTAATPSTLVRKPTTIRSDLMVVGGRGLWTRAAVGTREAKNALVVTGTLTLPAMVGPFVAMNETAPAPVICALVAVTA